MTVHDGWGADLDLQRVMQHVSGRIRMLSGSLLVVHYMGRSILFDAMARMVLVFSLKQRCHMQDLESKDSRPCLIVFTKESMRGGSLSGFAKGPTVADLRSRQSESNRALKMADDAVRKIRAMTTSNCA